jgi:uncharacterized protein DUF1543
MGNKRLFMLLIGASVNERHTEQHDIFFGIANEWRDLIPSIKKFWPGARTLHVDAWREVQHVQEFEIRVVPKTAARLDGELFKRLFFMNLGGYRANEFDEFHYRLICVADDKGEAIKLSKATAFFKHNSITGATSHIDDKYGVDVDDAHAVEDILDAAFTNVFRLAILMSESEKQDQINLGYFKFSESGQKSTN